MPTSPATRNYLRRFAPAMTMYVIVLLVAQHAVARFHPAGVKLLLLSVAPAIPILAVILAMARYVMEESDEYIRALFVRHVMAATGLLLAVTTVWGFLQDGGLAPRVPLYWTFILWCIALGGAQVTDWVIRKVRGDGA